MRLSLVKKNKLSQCQISFKTKKTRNSGQGQPTAATKLLFKAFIPLQAAFPWDRGAQRIPRAPIPQLKVDGWGEWQDPLLFPELLARGKKRDGQDGVTNT